MNRLLPEDTPCVWTGGNDDEPELLARIASTDLGRFVCGEESIVQADDDYEILSLGFSNKTPFNTPRELDEDELLRKLNTLYSSASGPDRLVMNVHVPPKGCGSLDAVNIGRSIAHVGSTAVRDFVEKVQPLTDLAGHVHEGVGTALSGRTRVFNPGSDCASGVLRAVAVKLVGRSIVDYAHLTR